MRTAFAISGLVAFATACLAFARRPSRHRFVVYHHDADGKWRVARDAWGSDRPAPPTK